MQSSLRSQVSGWVGFAGVAGALVTVLLASGCAGSGDPSVSKSGTGGSTGTGGGNATGGSTGTGGGNPNCTGGNDGAAIVTAYCALSGGCHVPGAGNDGVTGGLDLTIDANIGSRLVGATPEATDNGDGSLCIGNTTAYLKSGSNPATGLLIDKVTMNHPPCGAQMPASSPFPLTAIQQTCLIQWATTLTSP